MLSGQAVVLTVAGTPDQKDRATRGIDLVIEGLPAASGG